MFSHSVDSKPWQGADEATFDQLGRHIIILRPGTNITEHTNLVSELHESSRLSSNSSASGISHTYKIGRFQAYAGHFLPSTISHLEHDPDVLAIEADQVWATSAYEQQRGASRALELISHRDRDNPTRTYVYDSSAGYGTYVYIVDSGIQADHVDFDGRVVLGYNALSKFAFRDAAGHGTFIAGLVGATTVGVAKRCTMIAVKVSQLQGLSTVITDGIEWAINDVRSKRREAKAVLLLSMNGPHSLVLDSVAEEAYRYGITMVISAGNQGVDARETSPGRVESAIVVGATDYRRRRASWSNYGPNVGIYAPGTGMWSTFIGPSGRETKRDSGTSLSAALVAGLVAYFKGRRDLPNALVTRRYLYQRALRDEVHDARTVTSLFAYNDSGL